MGVFLGLDMGEKRIGVAISDENAIVATPFETLEFRGLNQLVKDLAAIVETHRVGKIVVGFPRNMGGGIGPAAQKVADQVEKLKVQLPVEWILWDERLTTQEVERILLEADLSRAKRKNVRDRLAAQRILQSYLDSQRRL